MRAGYGSALRSFLKEWRLTEIIDFGDLPVFEEATTYPCIMQLEKAAPAEDFQAATVAALDYPDGRDFSHHVRRFAVLAGELRDEGWSLVPKDVQQLLAKIRSKGVPLSEYVDGKIFYGIKTGLNEAFVIDAATRDRLIAEDPRSAEVTKPFLAGRDIKRYRQPESEKFLIFARRGIDIDAYPAILNYLSQFRERLEPKPKGYTGKNWPGRKPGTYKWYELQDAVDYYEEFEKTKIIYPNICSQPEFALDTEATYANQKTFIITSYDDGMLAVLNSSLMMFLFKNILPTLRGGYYEPSYKYFGQFPIVKDESGKLADLVELRLAATEAQEIERLEGEIDRIVFELYGLTEGERWIINNVTN